jgi:hypothetical protein
LIDTDPMAEHNGGDRAADTRRPVTSRDDDCAAQLPLATSPG